ncbi:MAG: hypothetical protein ACXADO_10670 [Candidatus Thorarchaeota archaeon]|jgi:hypothetical protein
MSHVPPYLQNITKRLVLHAYPEMSNNEIAIGYGRISSYANVRWVRSGEVQVICSVSSRRWPEPALLGLISHELNHRVQTRNWH